MDPISSSGLGMDDVLDGKTEALQVGDTAGVGVETPPGTGSGLAVSPADSAGFMLSNLQLGWVHVLGAALLLDALWLIHRVLHTVDTAERILYGDTMFIDLTSDGTCIPFPVRYWLTSDLLFSLRTSTSIV